MIVYHVYYQNEEGGVFIEAGEYDLRHVMTVVELLLDSNEEDVLSFPDRIVCVDTVSTDNPDYMQFYEETLACNTYTREDFKE